MASTTVEQVEMTPTSTAAPTPRSASPVAESATELFDASDSKEAFESYPDSGVLAWTQVASAFALFFTTMGGVYSWGVFQDALVAEGLAPSSTLAFIGSTQVSLEAIFAIPIGRLVGAFGPRRVAIVGSLFTGLGPVIAGSFVHSYGGLLVFEGLMYGLGAALCFFSVATLPSQYFLRRRNLATGLVYAGSGVGGAIFSIITSQLLKRVSLAWTFRIIGLIMTAINLPAALTLKARAAKKPLRSKEKGQAFDL
jgi:MFS family permease